MKKFKKIVLYLMGMELHKYAVYKKNGERIEGLIATDAKGLQAMKESFRSDFNNVSDSFLADA